MSAVAHMTTPQTTLTHNAPYILGVTDSLGPNDIYIDGDSVTKVPLVGMSNISLYSAMERG
eukprot:CAMPEP_0202917538 /NCGR_PEP_ID=MMETSP1392-20130828/71209_1 /ASSEMBLY_ACC=CAM_ASM_000868 /TAXON_ID=225041 /ORGANISM="Chlamydomonas chlamydogama, Strain SAG 11-48b" /LENGTH=60 /DNA_ID=CAMNT_0049610311 /DNA_START=16 /DNA_END=194 /DNA_ORIENTATION=+